MTASYYVGLFVRRPFRRFLMEDGATFKEEKGLLNSLFIVTAPSRTHKVISEVIQRMST